MPIYEFECLDCGSKFDYLVRSQIEAVHCPRCKLEHLKRLILLFLLTLKMPAEGLLLLRPAAAAAQATIVQVAEGKNG